MSIILDALRRADADRERARGTPPGLDALTRERVAAGATPAPRRTGVWLAALAGAAVLALGGWWLGRSSAPTPAAVAQAPATPTPGPAPVVTPPTPPTPAEPRTAQAAPRTAQAAPSAAPAASAAVPPQPQPPVLKVAPPVVPPTVAAAPQRPTQAAPKPERSADATPPAPAAADSHRVLRLDQLPAHVRSELPPLKVGGSMYSDQAHSRVLVLDGQVLSEGDTLRPGLVLEQIGPKSARLRWQEQRFEVGY